MKRRVVLYLSLLSLLVLGLMTGCSGRRTQQPEDDGRLNVVTTLFPYYDFLRQIAGDRIRLTLVVPAGMDSHSFEPTPADMITIQNADVLVCNGGAMEQWVSRVVASFGENGGPGRVLTMMDYVDALEEELVEGMEDAHDHDYAHEDVYEENEHDHDHAHGYGEEEDDGHGYEIEYDEHIWTSPVNAMKFVGILEGVLSGEDPENAEEYRKNADGYIKELAALDQDFREIVAGGKRHLLVFGDKFPLRYFFEEYGLSYRAAFSGCSTDTEPSARTIAYLIDKVREERIPVVYYLELSSPRVAEIIGEETGAEPMLFNTCHNVTRRQFDLGVTYLDLMRQNEDCLRKGLN